MKTSRMIGADDQQEGHGPGPQTAGLRTALREPVRQVDDERELRELRGVDRRQRPQLQPARRAADDDAQGRDEQQRQRDERHDVHRHRREAQLAVVDPHHDEHRDQARGRPTGSAARRSRRCRVGREVALAAPTTNRPSGCRGRRGRPRRPGSRSRPRAARAGPAAASTADGRAIGRRRGRDLRTRSPAPTRATTRGMDEDRLDRSAPLRSRPRGRRRRT